MLNGFVLHDIANPSCVELIAGFEPRLIERQFLLSLAHSAEDAERQARLVRLLVENDRPA